jgi:hypothetical protein
MKICRIVVAMLTLATSGCVSSAAIQRGAYQHEVKANALAAHGDYARAARERSAADKQFAKARARQYDEERWGIYHY